MIVIVGEEIQEPQTKMLCGRDITMLDETIEVCEHETKQYHDRCVQKFL
jgi:hypothetical protein